MCSVDDSLPDRFAGRRVITFDVFSIGNRFIVGYCIRCITE
jgi:hypothetical protein